jgi:pimeloyl-ACP methyl ester carboxylesterase
LLQPCHVDNVQGEAKCGKYEVYENRAAQKGRKISLNIVVVPSTSTKPASDPLFVLAGGPGQGAAGYAEGAGFGFLAKTRGERDLVFIDQRGTGNSNGLNCDLADDPADLQSFFGEIYPLEKLRQCRKKLEQIADLTQYTTPIAMDDLDEVRAALGYDKINLDGGSYGTFAAQIYLRQHPEHVRAVLLEGVASVGSKLPLFFAKGAQHALDRLFEDCAADAACHKAFPNFQKEFASVLERFDHGPITVELTNPSTGQKQSVTILRGNFVERLRLMLYTPQGANQIPALTHKAFENNYVPFATAAIRNNVGNSLARGMYFTITCSEYVPFITEQEILQETKGTFLGEYRVRAHIQACKEWPRAKIEPSYLNPVKSDLPVLMLSGDIDAATPYWLGESAVKYLPNGRQVLIRNAGHAFGNSCLQNIAAEFIEKGSAQKTDATCIKDIQRPPFRTE